MKALLLFSLLIISAVLSESIENDTDARNENSNLKISENGGIGGYIATNNTNLETGVLPTGNFVSASNFQLGFGVFALLSALFGLAGLVFRFPCLLRVTAGLYAVYIVVLTAPVVYFARIAIQAFLSENGSEWSWFYLLGLVFAIIFLAHGCMVILKARRETANQKEKYEHMTREEQWW